MTNPVLDAIHSRFSARSFTSEPLTDAEIDVLAQAALASPSATNRQPWQIIAVKDKSLIEEVEKATIEYFIELGDAAIIEKNKSRGNKVFYDAPFAIFLPIEDGIYPPIDCGIAVENIAIAAKSIGLDSVILGMPRAAFEGAKAQELAEKLKFPEGYKFGIAIAVGHAAKPGTSHERNQNKLTIIG